MTLSEIYYRSTHWKALRLACLERDRHCCVVPGCRSLARVADHIEARPHGSTPTDKDVLSNLRSLCLSHDAQVKEQRRGQSYRKNGGLFRVKGCDADGWPYDPARR